MTGGLISSTYLLFQHYISTYVEVVKSVDLFFNQFDTQKVGQSDARANPRVLIEIVDFEEMKGLGGLQTWEGNIILHIGIDITNTFANDSGLLQNNLSYLALLDNIYQKLQGITTYLLPDELQDINYRLYDVQRISMAFAQNTGAIKVSQIGFRFIIEDTSLVRHPIETVTEDIDTTVNL